MTHIYVPSVREGWEWALPSDESDNLKVVEAFGNPLGRNWSPIHMKVLRTDEHGHPWREADMPWMGSHVLLLRPRAEAVLRELCLRAGELLPLRCRDAELVAWNVTTTADALDHDKTRLTRFPSGRVMSIREYHFKGAAIDGLTAFRIPELRTQIFVSSEFVERVTEARLTGTGFEEVW